MRMIRMSFVGSLSGGTTDADARDDLLDELMDALLDCGADSPAVSVSKSGENTIDVAVELLAPLGEDDSLTGPNAGLDQIRRAFEQVGLPWGAARVHADKDLMRELSRSKVDASVLEPA